MLPCHLARMDLFAASKGGSPLHDTRESLPALVLESAPREQLCAWLRVPLELVMLLLAAGADAFVRRHAIVLDRPPLVTEAQGSNGAAVSALLANGSAPTGEEKNSVFLSGGGGDGHVAAVAGGRGTGVVGVTRSGGSGSGSGSTSSNGSRSDSSDNTSSSSSSSSSSSGGSECRTPLHFAASGGHVSAVKALVRAGVDIDVVDEEGCSALHLAVFRGLDKVVEQLVSAGAKVDTSDSEGETPLHTACSHGSLEMVRALLRVSRGQAISAAKGNRGVHLEMSPLHRACLGGHCEVMRELLEHGFDLDSLTYNARTPLHAVSISCE